MFKLGIHYSEGSKSAAILLVHDELGDVEVDVVGELFVEFVEFFQTPLGIFGAVHFASNEE